VALIFDFEVTCFVVFASMLIKSICHRFGFFNGVATFAVVVILMFNNSSSLGAGDDDDLLFVSAGHT